MLDAPNQDSHEGSLIDLIEVVPTNLKSFGVTSPESEFAQPSEEPLFFTITATELEDIITRAIQPLKDEVQDLKATVAKLEAKDSALEATQDTQAENEVILLRIINDLRHKEPGKTELSRAEKIEKYLQARQDHKATFETLKGHLGIDKHLLKQCVKTLMTREPGRYAIVRTPGADKRKRTLVMLPRS